MIHSDYVYSRDYRGKIKMVVLVFIFSFLCLSFFSVAKASIKEDLEKRGVFSNCSDLSKNYSKNIAKQRKFKALALNEKAECSLSENKINEAKDALTQAIDIFPDDLESTYLLLQIEFQESFAASAASLKINEPLYKFLINKVKGDWPSREFTSDPYHYIQEVASILTPYLIFIIYDFWKNMAAKPSTEWELEIPQLKFMIRLIGGETGCIDLLEKVHNKIKQYEAENASKTSKPIRPQAYETYSQQVTIVKKEVCPRLEYMITTPYEK